MYEQSKEDAPSVTSGSAATTSAPSTDSLRAMSYEQGRDALSPASAPSSASGLQLPKDEFAISGSVETAGGVTTDSFGIEGTIDGIDSDTGRAVTHTEAIGRETTSTSTGSTTVRTQGESVSTVDIDATVAANRDRLAATLVPYELELSEKRAEIERAKSADDTARVMSLQSEVDELEMELVRRESTVESVETLADLESAARELDVDPTTLETVDRTVSEQTDKTTTSQDVGLSGAQRSVVRETSESTPAGGTTNTRSASGEVEWGTEGVTAKAATSEATAVREGDVTSTSTVSSDGSVGVSADGLAIAGSLTESDSVQVADGDTSTTSTTHSGSANIGPDGVSAAGSRTHTRPGGGSSTTSVGGGLTDSTASGNLSQSGSQTDESGTWSYGCGGSAAITLAVTRVPASEPPAYQSVFTAKIGGNLSVGRSQESTVQSGEAELGTVSAGVSLSGSAAATLTRTMPLSPEDVARYKLDLDEWEATGKAPSGLDGFDIDKLRVLADNAGSPAGLLGFGSSGAASAMGTGESVSLDLAASGSLGGNVGGQAKGGPGITMSGSVDGSTGRTVSVTKAAPNQVVVAVSFKSAQKIAGELGVSVDVVSASLGGSEGWSQGASASFALDPTSSAYSYDGLFSEIVATERAELVALANSGRIAGMGIPTTSTVSDGATDSQSFGVGASGVQVDVGRSSTRGGEVTTDEQGDVTATFTGGNTSSVGITGGPLTASHSEQEAGQFSVDATGAITGSVSETTTSVVPGLNPGWDLTTLLKTAYPSYESLEFSSQDMNVLISRAGGNEASWMHCSMYNPNLVHGGKHTYQAWSDLRDTLNAPAPDPNYVESSPDIARRLTQARAMADFLQWPNSRDAVDACALHYSSNPDNAIGSEATDIGARTEWPGAIYGEKAKYEAAVAKIPALAGQLGADAADIVAGRERGLERCRAVTGELFRIHRVIESNTSAFETQAVAVQMMGRIRVHVDSVDGHRADFLRCLGDDFAPPLREAGVMHTGQEIEAGMRAVDRLEDTVREYGRVEATQFDAIRAQLSETYDDQDWIYRTWNQSTIGSAPVNEAFDQLSELYEAWKSDVLGLRDAYAQAELTTGWLVSTGRNDPRTDAEPDAATAIWLLTKASAEHTVVAYGLSDRRTSLKRFLSY
ncbi:MAG: hypothetical protein ACI9OJ_002928 [Myxococcota bacterium]